MKYLILFLIKLTSLFKLNKGKENKSEVPKDNYPMF